MSNRQTIFLASSYLPSLSVLLRGKFINHLAEHYRVVVLTPDITPERAKEDSYFTHPNVHYVTSPIFYPRFWWFMRTYLRLPFIRAFDDIAVSRVWYRPDHPRKTRLLIAIGKLMPSSFPNADFFTRLESLFTKPSPRFLNLVKEFRPVLVITPTPGYIPYEAEVITAARKCGLPTLALLLSIDSSYALAKFLRRTDYLCVWSGRMKAEMERFQKFSPKSIGVTGYIRFDHFFNDEKEGRLRARADFLSAKGLDPARKTVAYFTAARYAYPRPPQEEILDGLIHAVKEGKLPGRPNILIRLHPHDASGPYKAFADIPGVAVDRAGVQINPDDTKGSKVDLRDEDFVNVAETYRYSDVIINYCSSTTIEAAIFKKPVVSIGYPAGCEFPYEYPYQRDFQKYGICVLARNFDELCAMIRSFLEKGAPPRAKYKEAVNDFLQFTDGLSWKRAVEFTDTLLKRIERS